MPTIAELIQDVRDKETALNSAAMDRMTANSNWALALFNYNASLTAYEENPNETTASAVLSYNSALTSAETADIAAQAAYETARSNLALSRAALVAALE